MRRRVVITGIGWVTPWARNRTGLEAALGGRLGRGLHHALRRRAISPRRSPPKSATGTFPTSARTRRTGNVKAGTPISPSARRKRRWPTPASSWAASTHALRRLYRQRRRAARLLPLHGDDDRRAGRRRFPRPGPVRPKGPRSAATRCPKLEQEPNMVAGHLASLFDAQGPNVNCLTACAASSQAIGEAVEIIRRNEADVMLAGGTHTMIHPFGVTGFNLLTALSTRNDEPTRASRPFDRDRDGFVLGEGAGMVVLEGLDVPRPAARDLRRDRRLRLDRRRLPHHGHPPRRPRRDQLHQDGAGRRRHRPRRHPLHQRPRHEHRA